MSATPSPDASPPARAKTQSPGAAADPPDCDARRDWARSLQRCLLEREAALQEAQRATSESAAEIARLRETVAAQESRIAVLQGEGSDEMDGLEGLSVTEVRQAVRAALAGLSRMQAQCEAERRRRREAERERDELRRRLSLEGRSCGDEEHASAVAFVNGPLQRFLVESEELQKQLPI